MKVVGLTGGIGSGKTTVSKMFNELGVPVYTSDERAKQLMVTSHEIKQQLTLAFGEDSYDEHGQLNRSYLAAIVFNNANALHTINSIVHPAVGKDFKEWARAQESPYAIKETAILFENDLHHQCDIVITVTAPVKIRVARVMDRDDATEDQVLARAKNQWSDEQRVALSDHVINNIDLADTLVQVKEIHRQILHDEG